MKIILASASPRRRELLGLLGVPFEVIPSEADEHIAPCEPREYVSALALLKAREVARRNGGVLVMGADTVVVSDGVILGKPKDSSDAVRMLKGLSGKTHTVYTGVSVVKSDGTGFVYEDTRVVATHVTFRTLEDDEIKRYVESGEPMDKAGAYGIQGKAAVMAERLEGDYYNVVGLPVCTVRQMLKKAGVEEI